jgi:glycosyltransferase involved in cell wall biosynthesis
LRECLDSVLNQTYQKWDCIISDDASVDSSVAIAQEYEKKDSRFSVVAHNERVGAAKNWNRCLLNNKSVATKILCADDYLLPNALKVQMDLLIKSETSAVFNNRKILLPSKRFLYPKVPKKSSKIESKEAFKYFAKSGRNIFGEPVAVLFATKDLLNSAGFGEKNKFTLDLSGYLAVTLNKQIIFDQEIVGVFRISQNQWSAKLRESQRQEVTTFIDNLISQKYIHISIIKKSVGRLKLIFFTNMRLFIYKGFSKGHRVK